jgi:hypothetical protein
MGKEPSMKRRREELDAELARLRRRLRHVRDDSVRTLAAVTSPSYHVRRHIGLFFGASMAGGFALSAMIRSNGKTSRTGDLVRGAWQMGRMGITTARFVALAHVLRRAL